MPETKLFLLRDPMPTADVDKLMIPLCQIAGNRFFVVYWGGAAQEISYATGGMKYGDTWCRDCFKDMRPCSHAVCPTCHETECVHPECKICTDTLRVLANNHGVL